MNESVEFAARDGTRLLGTLTRPASSGPVPGALLINGSGPLDRDSNMPGQLLNVADALAATLAAHGVASLRYDKRGVGGSGGDYLSTGFDQETDDASAALAELRRFPGIDGNELTVVGHSAGATIAIRLASTGHGLAGAVLLCASSEPGAEAMRWQSERIAASLRGPSRLFARRFLRRQNGPGDSCSRRPTTSRGSTGATSRPAGFASTWPTRRSSRNPSTQISSHRSRPGRKLRLADVDRGGAPGSRVDVGDRLGPGTRRPERATEASRFDLRAPSIPGREYP